MDVTTAPSLPRVEESVREIPSASSRRDPRIDRDDDEATRAGVGPTASEVDELRQVAGGFRPGPADRLIGARVDRYRIVDAIGAGGMGCVYRAEQHEPVRRDVALKVLAESADGTVDIALAERFRREQQTLAQLNHPHIARLLDAGTLPPHACPSRRPYFVMELVDGQPLDAFCDEHWLSWDERVELVARLAEIVDHAHRRGILHRDLKPGNVLASLVDGVVQLTLIDFGIVGHQTGRPAADDAFVGSIDCPDANPGNTLHDDDERVGTPRYASPEQMVGRRTVDARTDIFSLGAILFRLLTGQAPIDWVEGAPPEPADFLHRLCRMPPPSLLAVADHHGVVGLPNDLEICTAVAMARRTGDRYDSALELAADLRAVLDGRPIAATPPAEPTGQPEPRGRLRSAMIGVTVAAAVGSGLVLALLAAVLIVGT